MAANDVADRSHTIPANEQTTPALPPGSILNGKQEHCTNPFLANKFRSSTDYEQISSVSFSLARPNMRSPSYPLPPLCNASVSPSNQMQVRFPQKIPTCRYYDICLYIMFETSLSLIKLVRESSGKTSCKWWVTLSS